jgi:hypothetical protein
MQTHTKEFLIKLASLMEEYGASLEIEGDTYAGEADITLEVLNPKTFAEEYDQWHLDHPGEKYDFNKNQYSYAEWVDLGHNVNVDKLKELTK